MEMSYNDLKQLDVINVKNGACLGRVCDIVFERNSGEIVAIIVPGKKGWRWFRQTADVYVEWNKITKIGNDVILVDLRPRREDDCDEKKRRCSSKCPPINPYEY